MKKACVLLPLVMLLLLPACLQAADLQAGWYVNIDGVHAYSYDDFGQYVLRGGANFYDTPPGQYWPFIVTDGQYHSQYQRNILIPTSVSGVEPGQSLIIPMLLPFGVGDTVAKLGMLVNTNYDSSQMYVQMWRQHLEGGPDDLIWENKQSGEGGFNGYLAYDTVFTGPFYFKINVVPEPSGLVCMLLVAVPLLRIAKRRGN